MKNLLLPLFVVISLICYSQTKIGNITVPDSIADKYFLYCYKHPDTVREKSREDYITIHWDEGHTFGYSDPVSQEQSNYINSTVDKFNGNLHKSAIGKAFKITPYKAHVDTSFDAYYSSGGHSKTYSRIVQVPEGFYTEFIGFLVPRKPTEIDFIKWKMKLTK